MRKIYKNAGRVKWNTNKNSKREYSKKRGLKMADEIRENKTCAYVNDDDGSDSAWCVQDFRKCDEERKEKCTLFRMEKEYIPKTLEQKLGYLIEECGELQSALGKTIRWGLDSYNPELPEKDRETNRQWILREVVDIERAIKFIKEAIDD